MIVESHLPQGQIWIRILMSDIDSENVAKRTWEKAGSHRSNEVWVWVIFPLLPDTGYILKDGNMAYEIPKKTEQ